MNTYICAPTPESADARAASSGITDGHVRVGPDPSDVARVAGGLLFSHDWRETFPPVEGDGFGIQPVPAADFLEAAHSNPDLTVELAP